MLTDDRALDRMACGHSPEFAHPVAAACRVYRGSIVALCQDGTIVQAGTDAPPSPIVAIEGVAQYGQDNSGTSNVYGANSGPGLVPVRRGAWALPFDVAPTAANKGAAVYAVDDETVSLTETPASGPARLQVGTLTGIDSTGTPWTLIS